VNHVQHQAPPNRLLNDRSRLNNLGADANHNDRAHGETMEV
jgi:hypothetical protein